MCGVSANTSQTARLVGCSIPVRLTSVFRAGGYHWLVQHHAQKAQTATIGRHDHLDQLPPVAAQTLEADQVLAVAVDGRRAVDVGPGRCALAGQTATGAPHLVDEQRGSAFSTQGGEVEARGDAIVYPIESAEFPDGVIVSSHSTHVRWVFRIYLLPRMSTAHFLLAKLPLQTYIRINTSSKPRVQRDPYCRCFQNDPECARAAHAPPPSKKLEAINDSRRRRQQKWPWFFWFWGCICLLRCCVTGGPACVASLPPWPFSDFHAPQLTTHRLCRAYTAVAAALHCADLYRNRAGAPSGSVCGWRSYSAALGDTGISTSLLLLTDAIAAGSTRFAPALASPHPHLARTLSAVPLLVTVALPLHSCRTGGSQPTRRLCYRVPEPLGAARCGSHRG